MGLFGDVGRAFVDPIGTATGGSVLDYVPGVGDARAQERANEANIKQAELNREFQERMSSTAYQRAMADMGQAGLNPMLAYQQGGASAPSGAQATVESASKTGLASKALEAYTGINTQLNENAKVQNQQAQTESAVALQSAQTASTVAQAENTKANTAKTIDSIKNQQTRRELERAQIPLAKVTEKAASMSHEGLKTIDRVLLKNTAKPSVNKKTLQYENPLIPKFLHPLIKKGK